MANPNLDHSVYIMFGIHSCTRCQSAPGSSNLCLIGTHNCPATSPQQDQSLCIIFGIYRCPLCQSSTGPPCLTHLWYSQVHIQPQIIRPACSHHVSTHNYPPCQASTTTKTQMSCRASTVVSDSSPGPMWLLPFLASPVSKSASP